MKGINSDEILDFAQISFEKPYQIRFIEYMPFRSGNDLLVPVNEIKRMLSVFGPLVEESYQDGPARVFRLPGAKGTIGFISPVTDHFCSCCNRVRLTADGKIKPCLLSNSEFDIKRVLRSGANDSELEKFMESVISTKSPHYDWGALGTVKRGMFQIGG